MEILDSDVANPFATPPTGAQPHPRRRDDTRRDDTRTDDTRRDDGTTGAAWPSADLDQPLDPATLRTGPTGPVRTALAALVSAEALGAAGLVIEVFVTGLTAPFIIWNNVSNVRDQAAANGTTASGAGDNVSGLAAALKIVETVAEWVGVIGLLGLALGVVGLFRLHRSPSTAGRALAGGATIVAVALLAVAAVTLWWATAQTPLASTPAAA